MREVFKINRTLPYNHRKYNEFSSRVFKTVKNRTEKISFLAPKVSGLVPEKIKNVLVWKLLNLNQEMETRLSMSVMQNCFATCWFSLNVHMFILQYKCTFSLYMQGSLRLQ